MNRTITKSGYAFLCIFPLLATGLAAPRPLRIPGLYQAVGGVHFAVAFAAAWCVGLRVLRTGTEGQRRQSLAGSLLLSPFLLIALLWVGLGTPWDATPEDNRMRYLALLAGSIAVTLGLVTLKEALAEAGERILSVIGAATGLLAGAAYLVWMTLHVGIWQARVDTGRFPEWYESASGVMDVLLFVACALTYLASAAFSVSLGIARWLGRSASWAFTGVSLVALVFLAMRGLMFPNPTEDSSPWYARPSFIAGIPAIPWIVPCLLGVLLLRRAGEGPAR